MDRTASKMVKHDLEGNFYVAEVNGGRFQKYRPRVGANPAYLSAPPALGSSGREIQRD